MLHPALKPFLVAFLRSRASKLLEWPADWLYRLVYYIRYARWFQDAHMEGRLVPTGTEFDYENRYALYQALCEEFSLGREKINFLEFGVASGASIRWWLEHNPHPESQFVGFDTFRGLPQAWGQFPEGAFETCGKPPDIADPRCTFQCGLFHETIPSFVRRFRFPEARNVLHLDADLYGSTLFVLVTLAPWLKRGDVLMFDEFLDVTNEFRALLDLRTCIPLELEPLRAVNWGGMTAFGVQ